MSAAYGEGGRAPDDPTEGKTMFYAPAAQAALGRPAPAWAQGEGQKIGDHVFYDDNSPTPAGATPTQGALPTAPAASTGAAATTDMKIISRLLNSTNPAAKAIGAKLMDNIVKNDAPTDNVKEFNAENALRAKQGKPALTSLTDFILEKGGKDREVKPMTDEQRRQWKVPEGVAAGMDDKGKPVFSQPSTVNTISPVVSGINDRFDKQLAGAQASHQTIASIHETRKALDGGAITGAFSDPRLKFAKIASLFGANGDAITNTETARAAVGEQVLQSAKTLGANPSNTDRDYIEKVKGGSIELNETSMRKLLDMQERWARDGVKRSNEMAEKLIQTDPEKLGRFKPMLMTDQPPSYEDYVKASPAAGAAAGAPAATTKIRKFNPATGKIE